MMCERFESSLRRHAFGDPAPLDLEVHLAGCAACRAALAAERELARRVDDALEESLRVEPSAGSLERVRRALVEDRHGWLDGWGPTVRVPMLALAAAVLLLALALGWLIRRPAERPELEAPSETVTRSAERLEMPVITETSLEGYEPVREVRVVRTKEATR